MNYEDMSIDELFSYHNKRNYVKYINGVLCLNVHFLTPDLKFFNMLDNNILKFRQVPIWHPYNFEIYKNIHKQILES